MRSRKLDEPTELRLWRAGWWCTKLYFRFLYNDLLPWRRVSNGSVFLSLSTRPFHCDMRYFINGLIEVCAMYFAVLRPRFFSRLWLFVLFSCQTYKWLVAKSVQFILVSRYYWPLRRHDFEFIQVEDYSWGTAVGMMPYSSAMSLIYWGPFLLEHFICFLCHLLRLLVRPDDSGRRIKEVLSWSLKTLSHELLAFVNPLPFRHSFSFDTWFRRRRASIVCNRSSTARAAAFTLTVRLRRRLSCSFPFLLSTIPHELLVQNDGRVCQQWIRFELIWWPILAWTLFEHVLLF